MDLPLLSYTLEIIRKKRLIWSFGKTTELFMVNLPSLTSPTKASVQNITYLLL